MDGFQVKKVVCCDSPPRFGCKAFPKVFAELGRSREAPWEACRSAATAIMKLGPPAIANKLMTFRNFLPSISHKCGGAAVR